VSEQEYHHGGGVPVTAGWLTGKCGIRKVAYASQRHPHLWLFERPGLLSIGEKRKKGLSVA
jgi:hypothetical protein